ncbi:hypothetical protein D3C71_1347860 [compost metagenome]
MHQLQQVLQQFLVVILGGGQAEAAAHQVQVMGLEQWQIQPEGFAQGFHADERRQGLGQGAEVPLANRHLVAEGITALVVGVVADEVGVEVVEEGERAEIEGDAQDRHVVGVHHPVAEAIGLPFGDQFGVALHHFAEHRQVRLRLFQALREVHGQHVITQLFLLLGALGVVEIFEVAEAHMARRQAQDHGCAFLLFAPHRGVGADYAQGAGGRDIQCVQGFGGEEFADRRAQYRPAITHA